MVLSRRFALIAVARFLTVCGLFFLPLPSAGQDAGLNLSGASNCRVADFDANLRFANGPDNYTIIIDKRNISNHACIFDGPMYGPTFVPDRVSEDRPFALCYDCENRLPNGQYPIVRPLTLDPDQVVRQTFRWKTTPPSEAIRCLQPKWMSGPLLLAAPSLLRQICSDIEVSRFSLVPSSESAATQTRLTDGAQVLDLKLASIKSTYYEGEMFSLRVSRTEPNHETASPEDSCPTLYLRERSPNGATRIDEVQPLAFKGCSRPVLGHEPGDWKSGFDLDSGANGRWEGAGDHAFELFQLSSSMDQAQLHFVSSNILRIQIADPTAIQRRWGQRVKGIAADITLDKGTFRVGEDVPLHLAIEDFDADVPVFSWDPLWDPCMVVGIEVQDAGGYPLPVNERFPNSSICMGHGFGPRPFPKGKAVPMERKLRAEGWLPNHPGRYKIVITWAPCFGRKSDPPTGVRDADLKPYAVVHATATIHLVSEGRSLPN